jgi:TRAP-type C4-dicarboxylate transport system permease small subunit
MDFWGSAIGKWLILLGNDQSVTLQYAFSDEGSRQVYLSFYNPNYAAVYLILVLPFALWAVRYLERNYQRLAALLLSAILLFCLWGTGSKAALVTGFLLILTAGFWYLQGIRRKLMLVLGMILCIGSYTVCSTLLTGTSAVQRIIRNAFPEEKNYKLQEVNPLEDSVEIVFDQHSFYLHLEEHDGHIWFSISDEQGSNYPLDMDQETGRFSLKDLGYHHLEFEAYREDGTNYIIMYRNEIPWTFEKTPEDDAYHYITLYGKRDVLQNAPYAFGKGYERAFSARIYLWSRTVPLVGNYLLWGSGPNTYALVFPQNDYVTRANIGLEMLMEIISRPHSFYLQTAVQTGLLSLLLLLLFFGWYLVKAKKRISLGRKRPMDQGKSALTMACMLSVLGFLIMGIANDSVVVVSPVFWAILGLGCSAEKN